METALLDCHRYGYTRIDLSVYKSNKSAVRFYHSFAFEHKNDSGSVTLPDGLETINQCMSLTLIE